MSRVSTIKTGDQTHITHTKMAKSTLTKKLENIEFFWSDYLPEDGIPLFKKHMKEVIELSKQYKKGGK